MRSLPGDDAAATWGDEGHTQAQAIERIRNERDRQDAKFGPPDATLTEDRWMTILTEEYAELLEVAAPGSMPDLDAAMLRLARRLNDREPAWRVQEELVQVAAVCVRWLETRVPRWGREDHEA